jgi:hypothetical protein
VPAGAAVTGTHCPSPVGSLVQLNLRPGASAVGNVCTLITAAPTTASAQSKPGSDPVCDSTADRLRDELCFCFREVISTAKI